MRALRVSRNNLAKRDLAEQRVALLAAPPRQRLTVGINPLEIRPHRSMRALPAARTIQQQGQLLGFLLFHVKAVLIRDTIIVDRA